MLVGITEQKKHLILNAEKRCAEDKKIAINLFYETHEIVLSAKEKQQVHRLKRLLEASDPFAIY